MDEKSRKHKPKFGYVQIFMSHNWPYVDEAPVSAGDHGADKLGDFNTVCVDFE